MTDTADLLTLTAAAAEFGYTRQTLHLAVREGRLAAFPIGGSRGLFVTRAAVRAARNSGTLGEPRKGRPRKTKGQP